MLNKYKQNEIINNFAIPFITVLCSGTNQGKMLKDFQKETGSKDYITLLNISNTYNQLMKCMKNFEELNKKFSMAMNTVVPHRWEQRYKMYVLQNINEQFELDPNKEFEARRLANELNKLFEDNPEIYSYYMYKQQHDLYDMLVDADMDILSERFEKEISDKEIEKMTEKILITETNVKFYHGTSYENYLKIIEDGFIKATDYSYAKYPNEKIEKLYVGESGYVFVMDSLDIPLAFSFGGYRQNASPWAYDVDGAYDVDEIGVVFEIDPTKYELYFLKKDNEFIIKGDIPIDDVNVLFFRMENKTGYISQITEEDLRKGGIIK